jgi:hypothetical protein
VMMVLEHSLPEGVAKFGCCHFGVFMLLRVVVHFGRFFFVWLSTSLMS